MNKHQHSLFYSHEFFTRQFMHVSGLIGRCLVRKVLVGRLRTHVRQAFSYGIRPESIVIQGTIGHGSLNHKELLVTVHWITMKTCCIPYEGASRTGIRKLTIIDYGAAIILIMQKTHFMLPCLGLQFLFNRLCWNDTEMVHIYVCESCADCDKTTEFSALY